MTDLTMTELAQPLSECLALAKQALERLPAERARADQQRNPLARQYHMGLCDGMEETLNNVFAPLQKAMRS